MEVMKQHKTGTTPSNHERVSRGCRLHEKRIGDENHAQSVQQCRWKSLREHSDAPFGILVDIIRGRRHLHEVVVVKKPTHTSVSCSGRAGIQRSPQKVWRMVSPSGINSARCPACCTSHFKRIKQFCAKPTLKGETLATRSCEQCLPSNLQSKETHLVFTYKHQVRDRHSC